MYANAQSVESTQGGGEYAHLGSLMPAAEYMIMSNGEEYITPDKPTVPPLTGTQADHCTQQRDYSSLYSFIQKVSPKS
jgi:hypothetical protein